MNAREFFYLVARMRTAQKEYFKARSRENLIRARVLETEVDNEIYITKEALARLERKEVEG